MVVVAVAVPSFWHFRASRAAYAGAAADEPRPASPAPESGESRPGHPES
jgi:hypothetical protein